MGVVSLTEEDREIKFRQAELIGVYEKNKISVAVFRLGEDADNMILNLSITEKQKDEISRLVGHEDRYHIKYMLVSRDLTYIHREIICRNCGKNEFVSNRAYITEFKMSSNGIDVNIEETNEIMEPVADGNIWSCLNCGIPLSGEDSKIVWNRSDSEERING